MSGSGLYGVDGTVTFDITFPRGTFHYAIDADGRGSWSGVLDGSSRYGSD